MYRYESWTIKKSEHWRIDAFELWCWWTLRVPWTTRRSNQSTLKEINPEYSLEGLMLKLKLQYFGHMIHRADSLKRPWYWDRLRVGEMGDRGWDVWIASPTRWTWVWANSWRSWRTEEPGALGRPRGRVWGGRREEGSGWGARVYLWRIHFDVGQN